jgi:hypothetical protein
MESIIGSIEFLFSAEVKRALLLPKIIFGLLSLFFIVAMIYFVKTSGYFRIRLWQDVVEVFTARTYGVSRMVKKWEKIRERLDLASEYEHKLAIIEADEILNEILERMGYQGETLREKLKQVAPAQLPNIELLQEAHQIRNNIVHDPDYRLSVDQARKTLEVYEEALKSLQVI